MTDAEPRKPGRPATYEDDRVTTAVRLPRALHDRLRATAEERDLSVNWIVNRAIERFLDDLLPVEEMVLTRRDRERHA